MNNNDEIVEIVYTEEYIKSRNRRIFRLTAISGLTLLVLIFATYAWFIGITTVRVDQFDVKVEAQKGLQISFTGDNNDWDTVGRINKSLCNTYFNDNGMKNNNWVADSGLVPISSAGEFSTTGHLKLYSNASINAVTGGYKIRTEKILNEVSEQPAGFNGNTTSPEKGNYITFDFFLKNTTNNQGTLPNSSAYTESETEAIYLTTNSSVTLPSSSSPDTDGMENTIRIAFYQVAYAPLTTTAANLKSMGCTSVAANRIVGTCTTSSSGASQGKAWNIWEPNDTNHQPKAISNFNRLCRDRTDATTYTSTVCTPIESNAFANGQSLTTYGVNKEIVNANNVNIYDGVNSYMGTINTGQYLKAVNSFKESQNVLASPNVYNTTRSPILRIEPNSITKIRAYIWIEGQDLDNVDYLGDSKKLLINFGFTKNIYEEEDVYPTPTS